MSEGGETQSTLTSTKTPPKHQKSFESSKKPVTEDDVI